MFERRAHELSNSANASRRLNCRNYDRNRDNSDWLLPLGSLQQRSQGWRGETLNAAAAALRWPQWRKRRRIRLHGGQQHPDRGSGCLARPRAWLPGLRQQLWQPCRIPSWQSRRAIAGRLRLIRIRAQYEVREGVGAAASSSVVSSACGGPVLAEDHVAGAAGLRKKASRCGRPRLCAQGWGLLRAG